MTAKKYNTQKPPTLSPGECVKKNPKEVLSCKDVPCLKKKSELEAKREVAAFICGPDLAAYRVINAVEGRGGKSGEALDLLALMKHLRDQAGAAQGGNMSQAEAMMMNQATALQSLFVRLVERGMAQTTIPSMESFMRLALRAQNQCRATLETLATIKNPPLVFARQANFANGPQQVNNGNEAPTRTER